MKFHGSLWLMVLGAAIAALVASGPTVPVKASDAVMHYEDVDAWFV